MNLKELRKHWNTITVSGKINDDKLKWFIDHSYEIVYNKLPKNIREKIKDEQKR